MVKAILHVNRHRIDANRKSMKAGVKVEDLLPPLSLITYKGTQHACEVVLTDSQGKEIARLVYRPLEPLSCGATVWLETTLERCVVLPLPGEEKDAA